MVEWYQAWSRRWTALHDAVTKRSGSDKAEVGRAC